MEGQLLAFVLAGCWTSLCRVCFLMWCSVAVATSMFSQKWDGEAMKGDLWAQLGNICGLGIAWELEVRSGLGKKSVQHLCSGLSGGVASLLEGKNQSVCLVHLCVKYRLVSTTSSPYH